MKINYDTEEIDRSTALEMIKIYYEEWRYRHENFWKRLTQFAIITFFTTSMPITFRIFEGLELPNVSMSFFPVCGAIFALISWVVCLSEYMRLSAVNDTIKTIIEKHLGESLRRKEITENKWEKFTKLKIGIWIPNTLLIIQFVFAGLIFWMILTHII